MATNRFDQYIPVRSTYLPDNFVPNFEAYKDLLTQEQGNFNKLQAVNEIPIDALAGADEEYAQQLRADLSNNVDRITEAYRNNIDEGRRASRDFIRQTRKRTQPGGDIRELALRKKQFTDFQTAQNERLEKGEITKEQYWASVQQAKQQYDTEGGYGKNARLNLNSRQQAVDFDEFSKDFLKNYEANVGESLGLRFEPRTGKMYFDKTKITELEASKIQRTLTAAYRNAAGQTGQLADLYNYRSANGLISASDNRGDAKTALATINSLNLDDPAQAGKAQKILNELGFNLNPDNIAGAKTMEAIEATKQLANMSDEDYEHLQKGQYLDSYINSLAAPYSDAKSFRRLEKDVKILGRTLDAELDLHARKKKIEDTPILFTGQGISMDVGQLAKSSRDLNESIKVQQYRIMELEAEREKVLEDQTLSNRGQEARDITAQINWEKTKLENMQEVRQKSLTAASKGYSEEVQQNLQQLEKEFANLDQYAKDNARIQSVGEEGKFDRMSSSSGKSYDQLMREQVANKFNISESEAQELLDTRDDMVDRSNDYLEQNSQLSLATIQMPDKLGKGIQSQLNAVGFDFYNESGQVINRNQSNFWGKEKDGTRPIMSERMKVRNISQSSYGNMGHMITIEDTETGDVYYASPRNSNMSDRIGNWLLENGDEEAKEIGFMMTNGRQISSQVNDIKAGQSVYIAVGADNEINVPVTKEEKASGLIYTLTVPYGPDQGKRVSYNNDEELGRALYKIDQYAKQQ